MKHPTVALLFGGKSPEHSVSLASAAAILPALREAGFHTLPIGISRTGEFRLTNTDPTKARLDAPPAPEEALYLSPRGDFLTAGGRIRRADAVFPALHGKNGEDGVIQGFLDTCGIPYVGCGVEASVLAMHKSLAKRAASDAGVPVLPEVLLTPKDDPVSRVRGAIPYPVFVKPARSGSSVGAGIAANDLQLTSAVAAALADDTAALAEPFLDGAREIEVAVLEDREGVTVSVPGEVIPHAAFYDYKTKYESTAPEYRIPADLPADTARTIREAALAVFRSIGCRHLSRVDFFVKGDAWYFNEINTLPGFTGISMYPRLMAHAGISLPDLVGRLVRAAL